MSLKSREVGYSGKRVRFREADFLGLLMFGLPKGSASRCVSTRPGIYPPFTQLISGQGQAAIPSSMGDSAMQGDVSAIGDAGPVRIPITVTGAPPARG